MNYIIYSSDNRERIFAEERVWKEVSDIAWCQDLKKLFKIGELHMISTT
jgi:hypothetical protein